MILIVEKMKYTVNVTKSFAFEYHRSCCMYAVKVKPQGNWACYKCRMSKKDSKTDQDVNRLLPLIPPHLHPHTGQLPDNWEEFPLDNSIPDVTNWQPLEVCNYLVGQGIGVDQASVFVSQEIGGKSLLLLHRQDVLNSLGLKLGPVLKVFKHVKRLQMRRNVPN